MLSWLERKAAATLYATPPSATLEETLAHFLKVITKLLDKRDYLIITFLYICVKLCCNFSSELL